MNYNIYATIFATFFTYYSFVASEMNMISCTTISQQFSVNSFFEPRIDISYIGDNKIITCPKGTIFDQHGSIYEHGFFYIKNTGENIRKGIIGKAIEKFARIGDIHLSRTKGPITIITKIPTKKIPSKL